jgi:heme/copper-type cytochrome/quinol oxidase subunit 3
MCSKHIPAILNIPVTSQSTFVLLMSSLAMVLALAAVENKDKPLPANAGLGDKILASSKLWLFMTALMGATFLGYQAYEFTSFVKEGLTIKTNLFGSSFFTLTGFHGAHVSAGVLWLLTLLAIDFKRGLGPKDALIVDICALYWHFVDVVWIAIFTLVYLIK